MNITHFQSVDLSVGSEYHKFYSSAKIPDIYPTYAKPGKDDGASTEEQTIPKKLESVSVYKVIDLLGEGPIQGLVNQRGDSITLSNDITKNENGFRGIYLNDVAVKNTFSEFLNYNRVFAEFRNGEEDQPLLSFSKNSAFSFRSSSQTFNLNSTLPGLSAAEQGALTSVSLWKTLGGDANKAREHKVSAPNSAGDATNPIDNDPSPYYSPAHAGIQSYLEGVFERLPVKTSHVITNDNADGVEVGLRVDALYLQSNSGKQHPLNIYFCIRVGYENDSILLGSGGSLVYIICPIGGIATSQYVRSTNVKLPPSINGRNRQISIFMVSSEDGRVKINRRGGVAYITEHISQELTYPNSVIMASIFDARAFSSIPKRSYDLNLLEINVPNNYDPKTRVYNGSWSGEFAPEKRWTDNPAWIFFDLVTNERYGLGKYNLDSKFVDRWNMYSIAKYCDEFVPTGFTARFKELPFSINKEGVEVTLDDSSSLIGGAALEEIFPHGETVCLFDLVDEDSAEIAEGYKRVIYNPVYNNADFTFKFTILKEVSSIVIFDSYPSIKKRYLNLEEKQEASEWILNTYVINQDENETAESLTLEFLKGEPINSSARSGNMSTQFKEDKPILEPRFSANVYLDKEQDAYNALNDIASIFRGMVYWSNSHLFLTSDKSKDSIYIFNNSNVKDGDFVYTGGSKSTRFSAVLVRYNDQYDNFKPKVEYIEDPAGIREFGYLEKKIIAIGTTSKSQAHRLGKWVLSTSQTESELIQFSTGAEATMLKPGDVVSIQDRLKTTKRYGGRITGINHAARSVTLDAAVEDSVVGQKVTFIVPKEMKTGKNLSNVARSRLRLSVELGKDQEGISDSDIDQLRQSQIKQFTIASLDENTLTVSELEDDDFSLIPNGSIWTVENLDPDVEIKDVKYRVISIVEQSINEYQLTCLIYNETKFNHIDRRKRIAKTQFSKPQVMTSRAKPSALSSTQGASLESLTVDRGNATLNVNFDNIVEDSGVNRDDIGGYKVEVRRGGLPTIVVELMDITDGRGRVETLGANNTSFKVFLGPRALIQSVSYRIYVFNKDNTFEEIGLPV